MSEPIITPAEETLAVVLAEHYSSPYGDRNKSWDIDRPDGPDNPYYLTRPMSERVKGSPYVHFDDTDGCRSFRSATYREIAATLVGSGAVLPVSRLTDPTLVDRVLDASFPEVPTRERATLRAEVSAVLTGLAVVLREDWCHCGSRVAGDTAGSPAGRVLCEDCVTVRCAASPGECRDTPDTQTG